MRDVTFLAKKRLELEIERYQLHIVGLTSMYYSGHGIRCLERGCTLSFFRILLGERHSVGVQILLSPCTYDFKLLGGKVLSVVVAYAPNGSADYPAFLESVGIVLEGMPSGGCTFLIGRFQCSHGQWLGAMTLLLCHVTCGQMFWTLGWKLGQSIQLIKT